jgi:hypothetical protein
VTTVTVMFDPALVALTSTPSIAVSSAELTTPVNATGACAEAVDENAAARARPKAKPAAAKSGWRMGSSRHSSISISIGSPARAQQALPAVDRIASRAPLVSQNAN